MSTFPSITGSKLVQALRKIGFKVVRETELDGSAAIKRWSMQVLTFLNTALGTDEANNFLELKNSNEYDEYALRAGHLQGLIVKEEELLNRCVIKSKYLFLDWQMRLELKKL